MPLIFKKIKILPITYLQVYIRNSAMTNIGNYRPNSKVLIQGKFLEKTIHMLEKNN